jgi:uncharacterized protein (TIGR03086 family)
VTAPQELLSRALDQAEGVLAAVRSDQRALPTPCGGWDVAQLAAHLAGAPARFVEMATGGSPDWSSAAGSGSAAEFRAGADSLLEFWQGLSDDTDAPPVDWQLAELAVHTWDLARATGQTPQLDDEVAERGLAFMAAGLTAENRGAAFGPEVAVPADAPAYDRLAAMAGRDPFTQR